VLRHELVNVYPPWIVNVDPSPQSPASATRTPGRSSSHRIRPLLHTFPILISLFTLTFKINLLIIIVRLSEMKSILRFCSPTYEECTTPNTERNTVITADDARQQPAGQYQRLGEARLRVPFGL